MNYSGTFSVEDNSSFKLDHELDEEGDLSIWFHGSFVVRHGDRFDQYLSQLEALAGLADDANVKHVYCHLEHLGEVLSRAQHAIYRMLHAMRAQGHPVTIYATDQLPEQSEHLRMSRLFVDGLSKQPGAPVKLTEIRRAS